MKYLRTYKPLGYDHAVIEMAHDGFDIVTSHFGTCRVCLESPEESATSGLPGVFIVSLRAPRSDDRSQDLCWTVLGMILVDFTVSAWVTTYSVEELSEFGVAHEQRLFGRSGRLIAGLDLRSAFDSPILLDALRRTPTYRADEISEV